MTSTTHGGKRLADAVLTIASVGGVICILLVIAATMFHITLIMFKTGSMSPTIPAGSLAVVREIPASEARVGDVLTIARPGELPITHRVTSISPAQGTPLDGTVMNITMKGDANDFEDPAPYTVSTARIVLYSVPGLAAAVVAVSHPLALGSITVGAALLVTWAFWPRHSGRGATRVGVSPGTVAAHGRRRQKRQRGRRRGVEAAGVVSLVFALAVVTAASGNASPARADAQVETTVTSRYLTLVSISDPTQASSLSPGRPVPWQVGVTVAAPEPGTVHIGLSAEGELTGPGELALDVRACPERWVNGTCASGESLWLPRQDLAGAVAPVASSRANPDGAREIGQMAAATSWLMLRVVMPESLQPGSAASLRLHAWGAGDVVAMRDAGGHAARLAATGFRADYSLALAATAVGTGLALAGVARLRGCAQRPGSNRLRRRSRG